MKKTLLALSLILAVLLFSACAEGETTRPEESGQNVTAQGETGTKENELPPETVPAGPTDPGSAVLPAPTPEQARKIVLDYFKEMGSVEWVCKTDMDFTDQKSYTSKLLYKKGETYYGLPYVSRRCHTDQFLFCLDENKVYNGPVTYEKAIGNSCATATRVALNTVSGKVTYTGTQTTFPWADTGMVAVGNYSWEGVDISDLAKVDTVAIVQKDVQTIYDAYALCLPCDVITQRHVTGSSVTGHARMVSEEPVIVRKADGVIVPSKCYLITYEQNSTIRNQDKGHSTWRLGEKYPFTKLAEQGYLPMRLEEFAKGEFEDAVVEWKNVTPGERTFFTRKTAMGDFTCNYPFLAVRADLKDSEGKTVSSARVFPSDKSRTASLGNAAFNVAPSSLPEGVYTYTVTVKIGLGTVTCCEKTLEKK